MYVRKNISLKKFYAYESSDIDFVDKTLYFVNQINGQSLY
jgi:hypothetical protein